MSKKYSAKEKEDIFVNRTKEKYPSVWNHYISHISHEKMSLDELHAYNFAQRKKIVAYAYYNTEFYRNFYDEAGFSPDDLKEESDWEKIPVVTKQMIRDNYDKIVVGGRGVLASTHGKQIYTGGSTGMPLPIIRDIRYEQAGSTVWRSRGWWMRRPLGEPLGDIPVLGQNEGIVWRMKGINVKNAQEREEEKKLYFPMRKYYLDAQEMSPDVMRRFVDEVKEDGVTFLRGYAGAMTNLAQFCLDTKLTLQPSAVSVVSNPIDQIQRRIIKKRLIVKFMIYTVLRNAKTWP